MNLLHANKAFFRLILISVILTICFLISHIYPNQAIAARLMPILGKVSDLSEKPVINARVMLVNEGDESSSSSDLTYTDEKGEFHFINKNEGIYSISVYKDGYLSYQDSLQMTPATRHIVKITMTKSDSFEPEVIYLAKNTGNLYGNVICDETDDPVADAVVSIGDKFIQTNGEGCFKFENIGVGPKFIKTQKNGFHTLEKEITVSIKNQNIVIRLNRITKYATILGNVKIKNKKNYECPPIKVYLLGKTAVTDYKGDFKFENIREGSYPIILIYNKKEIYNDIIRVEKGISAYDILLERL